MAKSIYSNAIDNKKAHIKSMVRENHGHVNSKAQSYNKHAQRIADRLEQAVGMNLHCGMDYVTAKQESEEVALNHLRRTAKKILSQMAQGRRPFVTFKQILIGMEKAEKRARKAKTYYEGQFQWTLSARLGMLADEVQNGVLDDACEPGDIEARKGFYDQAEHYLLNNVSIGRVLAVNPQSLYRTYTKVGRLSFVTIEQMRKGLDVADKSEDVHVYHTILNKFEQMHEVDNEICLRENREEMEFESFLEMMHPTKDAA